MNIPSGVHVEFEPFGTTRPGREGRPGPKDDLGAEGEEAYVEFDAPPDMVRYYCGPRNTAIVPLDFDSCLSLEGRNAVYVKVRQRCWQFWRTRAE